MVPGLFQLIMQYQSIGLQDDWASSPPEQTRPRTVKRGIESIAVEIPEGESHLYRFFTDFNSAPQVCWVSISETFGESEPAGLLSNKIYIPGAVEAPSSYAHTHADVIELGMVIL